MDPVAFINKWMHLTSICIVLGGTIVAALAFYPGLTGKVADGEARPAWNKFGIILAIAWVVVLITGFLNLYIVTPKVNGSYQMIAGMKIMAAIIMFVLTMLIGHPIPALKKFTANKGAWYTTIAILGLVVLGLSAHMNMSRISGSGLKTAAEAAVAR